MRLVVLDGALFADARARAGDEDDVYLIAPSPDELERALDDARDPRVYYLIGDGEVLPLPDAFVDEVHGAAAADELRRVRR